MKVSRLLRFKSASWRTKFKKKHAWLLLFIGLLIIGFIGTSYFFVLRNLPLPTKLNSSATPQSTQIFDRNQKLIYTIYTAKNQSFVPFSQIPKHMRTATIAIEDKDFYSHGALDFRGIFRSLFSIVVHQELQGGSTITQQLVKNSLLTPERTILRKIKEIILAFATETLYSKDKILEMYLNQIPYGGTVYGVEAASQTFFGKNAKGLTLAQSALLAGLPESPTTNSPFGSHPEFAKKRQEAILNKMYEQKYISKKERDDSIKEPLKFQTFTNIFAPHFVLYVKDLLTKKYGEKTVAEGGLRVITSLDSEIQQKAQDIVTKNVDKLEGYHATNGSSLITNPATGEILSMVGSKDYFDEKIDGNVNITLALRQPGSSIKPINYAVGLIRGYTGATTFIDQPICFPTNTGAKYCPVNYDGKFNGVMQMRYALGNSINIPAIKMLKVNTIEAMIATASAMGITTFNDSPDKYGLSLTLGGGEVTMLEMAQSYGVFANGGYKINLHPILKITDKQGKILDEYKPPSSPIFGKKILPEGVAFIISDILADNNARLLEFGSNSSLKIPNQIVSAKTGTTNDFRDNWTIGYTPDFVVVSWVGNNDNTPMNNIASGITGAAPIWHEIMTYLLGDLSPHPISRPPGVIQKKVCSLSGLIPPPDGTPNRCETRFEYFIKGTEPNKVDPGLQKVKIDKKTNDLAALGQTDNVEERDNLVITDVTGQTYCATCPHPNPTPTAP